MCGTQSDYHKILAEKYAISSNLGGWWWELEMDLSQIYKPKLIF